jgi:fatty-acyl-CoA synthase
MKELCREFYEKGENKLRLLKLIFVLYKMNLLSPIGLSRLVGAIAKEGTNLMALLSFAEKVYPNKVAIVDDEKITYQKLFRQSEKFAYFLFKEYQVKSNQKIAFLCKNHVSFIQSLFAVSRLGADIYFLNTEMSKEQCKQLLEEHQFHLLIYDIELEPLLNNYCGKKMLSSQKNFPVLSVEERLPRMSTSKLMLLTGGTTGKSKVVPHKPSLFNYLNPFLGMISRLKLLQYHTAYIATPIYHGYGIAVLLLFFALGKKVVVSKGFDAKKACEMIRQEKVEVVTVVPLMLHKMLKYSVDDLRSLTCIASGGAELNSKLVDEIRRKLGDVLYNLYGSSEGGLNMIASPEDLKLSSSTIGRKIKGVHVRVLDKDKKEVKTGSIGQFCVKHNGTMLKHRKTWIETGDAGYMNADGLFHLCGRMDDMVVSGGENVYPIELERILIKHPQVEDVAVIGVKDEQFGQRLQAFVLLERRNAVSQEELYKWLRARAARFQMPKEIIFINEMPYTAVGKLDKKKLRKHPNYE